MTGNRKWGWLLVVLAVSLFIHTPALKAQSITQTIQGLVSDATGAVIPGATVSYMNLDTGVSQSVQSNETGNYTFALVPVGNYEITCQLEGFKTNTTSNQRVETAAQVRIDFTLEIGDVTETVEVSAAAVTLQTENATVGAVVENRRIIELPLNGRNIVQLAVLVPGVQYGQRSGMATGEGGFPVPGASYSVSANGVREIHQVVSLDGVDAKDPRIHITPFVPSIEAIEEFKITTSAYNAEVGFGGGAVTNITMKSGTNELHGTLFEFLRNDALDADPYFLNFERPADQQREANKRIRNQFGFVVSGPIKKNKTFFMADIESRQDRNTGVSEAWFPLDDMRGGDFSELLTGTMNPETGRLFRRPIVVYDAFTGDPFPNNVIPQNRLHPGVVNNFLPQLVPTADFRDTLGDPLAPTVRKGIVNLVDSTQYYGRIDHHFSDADRVFGRLAWDDSFRPGPTINPNFSNDWVIDAQNLATQWIHTFNQNMINELRFGFSFSNNDLVNPRTNDESFNMDDFGIGKYRVFGDNNRPLTPFEQGVVQTYGAGMPGMRDNSITNKMDSLQAGDHISLIKGSHNLKFGGEMYRVSIERAAANFASGRITMHSRESGNNFASFLLGLPTSTLSAEGVPFTFVRAIRQGYYVHDDWKVNSRLTLNMGLRFEYLGNPRDIAGLWRTINFPGEDHPAGRDGFNGQGYTDPVTGERAVTAGPTYVDERGGVKLWKQDIKFFMPRLGVAFRPADGWVLRAGGGWYANLMHQNNFTILNLMPPKSGSLEFQQVTDFNRSLMVTAVDGETYRSDTRMLRPGAPLISLNDPFAEQGGGVATVKPVRTYHVKPDYKDGDTWRWSMDVQRDLGWNTALTVGYVGSKSTHVANSFWNWNNPLPSPDTNVQANRPFPRFFDESTPSLGVQGVANIRYLDSYGDTNHHGFQAKLEKRYSSGVTFGMSYTWSKTLGNGEAGGNQHAYHQNSRLDRSSTRGRLRFDQQHMLVSHWVWDMPGRNLSGPLKYILGGWQNNGILSFRSGFPMNITNSFRDLNLADSTSIRPDLTGDWKISNPNRKLWYNTQAFQRVTCNIPEIVSTHCHYGDLGYAVLTTPAQGQLDFGFFKNIPIGERFRIQFRSEFFNATNSPWFGAPGNISFSGQSLVPDGARNGEIRSTRSNMRIIQFGLKLHF